MKPGNDLAVAGLRQSAGCEGHVRTFEHGHLTKRPETVANLF
jgi:hypothetical protein